MNVLITSAGQRVSLVRAFKRELEQLLPGARVFTTDIIPQLSPACAVSDKYFTVSKCTDPHYIDELLSLCTAHSIAMVIPTIDGELQVFADNKELFRNAGIHLIIGDAPFVAACRDKRQSNNLFLQKKIDVPAPVEKNNPSFPLFIKPYDGSLSADTYTINKKEELTDAHLGNDRFMFMEYLDSKTYQEYTIDMYYGRDAVVKCIVPRRRIAVRAGEIRKGLTCRNPLVALLKEKLQQLDGAAGCITMQLFLHNKTHAVKATEINPRFGGGYPLSYAAGANFPKWLIQEYLQNQPLTYTEDWEDNLLMLRYDDEILIHDYKGC